MVIGDRGYAEEPLFDLFTLYYSPYFSSFFFALPAKHIKHPHGTQVERDIFKDLLRLIDKVPPLHGQRLVLFNSLGDFWKVSFVASSEFPLHKLIFHFEICSG